MSSAFSRRVLAVTSALALAAAGTLAASPALAADKPPVEEQSVVGPITPRDTTAPTVIDVVQTYQSKEGGRTAVTLTFSENLHPEKGVEQGWYGSGNVWTKVYYRTKTVTVNFADRAGNWGSYTIDIDGPPAIAGVTQVYQAKEGGRAAVTVTFTEPVSGLGQGWNGSGAVWTKIYYRPKTDVISFTDSLTYTRTGTIVIGPIAP